MAVPLNNAMGPISGGVAIEGQPVGSNEPLPQINFELASPDYISVLAILLLAGRFFSPRDDAGAPPVVIVNDRVARHFWPDEKPIGHRVAVGGSDQKTWVTVVGVARDVHQFGLDKAPADTMYIPVDQ
jgi:MacB-like periplasmic core domain